MDSPDNKLPVLEVPDRAALREYLGTHHESRSGVWLAIAKKNGEVAAPTYDEAVEEALCFGWIDSTARRLDEHRYFIRLTPRRPGSIWSRPNKLRIDALIDAGLMTPAGMAAVERARADGSWDILDTVDSLELPVDLEEALEAAGARHGFEALPASRRKQLLYAVLSAKRPQTRATRIASIIQEANGDGGTEER